MKNILRNRKKMTGLIALLVGVTIFFTGLTLAWLTSSDSKISDIVNAGGLDIVVELEPLQAGIVDPDFFLTPGLNYGDNIGTIRRVGNMKDTIRTVAQLKFDVEVLIKRDAAGKLLPQSEWYTRVNPAGVKAVVQEKGAFIDYGAGGIAYLAHPLGHWYRPAPDNTFRWYHWGKGSDGNTYVILNGDEALRFAYAIETDGAVIGNEFKNASMSVKVNVLATQAIPDVALVDVFGVGYSDITWYTHTLELPYFIPFSADDSNVPSVTDQLVEEIQSLPNGGYKTLLEDLLAKLK